MPDDLQHNMHRKSTWDRFYVENNQSSRFRHFDWFFSYKHVAGFLQRFLQREADSGMCYILDVGCGTSDLGLGLYRDSTHPVHVCCVDFSPVAIRSMKEHFAATAPAPLNPGSELHFREADATDLAHVGSHTFHLVLDKGTTDALLRGTDGAERANKMLAECLRVLRPGGILLQFSDEDPDARMPQLEQPSAEGGQPCVQVQDLGVVGGIQYYAYILSAMPKSERLPTP
ncbi:citrate synthase-lysine N-methyltransferase CSKMT, mitochondrial isoform X2 [Ambystoma mexicanum]|uniref:citrate synthase-lysine N-methyltransferase CSKMT, mitochondrial isoform X2 n=1 Tax=Ambystoma mexicanum TaxID=8296 RepID=UPI0037E7E507